MPFHPAEQAVIDNIDPLPPVPALWVNAGMEDLFRAPPAAKGKFARNLISELANEVGVSAVRLPGGGRRSRLKIGKGVCEIKFSMEDTARFQQVRPPSYGYDFLIAVGAHPNMFIYWFLPAADIDELMADDTIFGQHADDSRWFFPDPVSDNDPFAPWRYNTAGLIAQLSQLA